MVSKFDTAPELNLSLLNLTPGPLLIKLFKIYWGSKEELPWEKSFPFPETSDQVEIKSPSVAEILVASSHIWTSDEFPTPAGPSGVWE